MGMKSEGAVPNAWIYVDVKGIDMGTYVQMAMRAVNEAVAKGQIICPAATTSFGAVNTNTCCAPNSASLIVVPLTLLIIILIIYLNTRSLVKTAIVLLAVPFSLVGAFWFIYLAGLQLERGRLGRHHRPGRSRRGNRGGHAACTWTSLTRNGPRKAECASVTDLRDAIYHGAVKRVRPKAMTAAVIIARLVADSLEPRRRRRRHETHRHADDRRRHHLDAHGAGRLSGDILCLALTQTQAPAGFATGRILARVIV